MRTTYFQNTWRRIQLHCLLLTLEQAKAMTNPDAAPSKAKVMIRDAINVQAKERMNATGRPRSPPDFTFPLIPGIG